MKHLISFVLFLTYSLSIHAQNASVQVVHAIADTNFKTVDFWLFNSKIADNISFREATSFISFPAVIQSQLRICDSASTDTLNPLYLFKEQLTVGEKYIMVISGIADSNASYSPFKPLTAHLAPQARELSQFSGYSDGIFFHAVTDAGTLSVSETRELFNVLESSLSYGDFSDYNELETSNYRLRLKELSNSFPTGEFDAFMASMGLDDSSVVILISGFKHPELNSNGPSLSVDLITSSGTVYSLPKSSSKVQFLHNSADPSFNEIDIYVNDQQVLNGLDFLSGSGYLTFPSGTELEMIITNDSAAGSNESILTKSFVINANSNNIAMFHGAEGSGFSPSQPLDIHLRESRVNATSSSDCDILFFNGSTDFGSTTLKETSVLNAELFANVAYSEFSDYISLPATNYEIDVLLNDAFYTRKGLNLNNYNLAGSAITLLSVGFADTTQNSNGEEFGLWFSRSSSGKFTQLSEPVGLADQTDKIAPRLYPNPASSEVVFSSSSPIEYVLIHNLHGQTILNEQLNTTNKPIDVRQLIRGVYMVEISINGMVFFEKLIVE